MLTKRLSILLLALFSFSAHAQLAQVGSGASYDNGGSTWGSTNVTKDTGSASGDLAIIAIYWYENGSAGNIMDTPTGFTDHGSFVLNGSGDTESRVDVFTRALDGSEGASYGVTLLAGSTSIFATVQLLTLRGTNALSVDSVTDGTPVTGTTSVAAPSAGTANKGIAAIYGLSDPPGTVTGPSGMTLGISEPTEQTNNGRIYYETLGTAGTRTLSWTNSRDAIGITVLIDGASAGGGSSSGLLRRRRGN